MLAFLLQAETHTVVSVGVGPGTHSGPLDGYHGAFCAGKDMAKGEESKEQREWMERQVRELRPEKEIKSRCL